MRREIFDSWRKFRAEKILSENHSERAEIANISVILYLHKVDALFSPLLLV